MTTTAEPPPGRRSAWRTRWMLRGAAVLLLLGLLPLLLMWSLERQRERVLQQQHNEQALRLGTAQAAAQLEQWLQHKLQWLQLAAALYAQPDAAAPGQPPDLQLPAAALLPFERIHVGGESALDPSPETLVSRLTLAAAELQLVPADGGLRLRWALPLAVSNGAHRGTLFAELDAAALVPALSRFADPLDARLLLLAADGRLIAEVPRAWLATGAERVSGGEHPAYRAAQRGEFGPLRYAVDGHARLASSLLTEAGWLVVLEQPLAEQSPTAAHGWHAWWTAAVAAALAVLAAIGLTWWLTRELLQPIVELTDASLQLTQGHVQTPFTGGRGRLLDAPMQAIEQLRQRLQQLLHDLQQALHAEQSGRDLPVPADAPGAYGQLWRVYDDCRQHQRTLLEQLRFLLERYAVGDLTPELAELPGQQRRLSDTAAAAKRQLLLQHDQLMRLIDAAIAGDFSERAVLDGFQHTQRDTLQRFNRLMQAADTGLGELSAVLSAIAQGELHQRMRGRYQGRFAQLQRDSDASARSLAELIEALQRSRRLLSAILAHLPQGVRVVDQDLRLIAWNAGYLELFNYPPGAVRYGVPLAELLRLNAGRGQGFIGDDEEELQQWLELLRQGRRVVRERSLTDGRVLEVRGEPLPGIGYLSSFSDVTAYKRAEAALRALTSTLEAQVANRTRELEQATAEAHRANRAKTRFLAAAVHDLSQPITAARLFIDALRRQLKDAGAAGLADRTEATLATLQAVLGSLMDISRLESGRFAVNVEAFALSPLLDSLRDEFALQAQQRGLRLRIVGAPAVLFSDPQLLRRVLQNYLSNALRYTRNGGVLLAVRRIPGGRRFAVYDSGCGIEQASLGDIFEEFRRLDAAPGHDASADRAAAGLGLSIVRNIARALEHPIGVRSRPGRGSVFWIDVGLGNAPASTSVPIAVHAEGATTVQALAGREVWCIDDDHDVRDGLGALLTAWGCRVTVCASADAALRRARRAPPPDLLLVDYRIGDLDGLQLLGRLDHRWECEVPALMLTAEPIDRLAALAGGRVSLLAKPVDAAQLAAAMLQRL